MTTIRLQLTALLQQDILCMMPITHTPTTHRGVWIFKLIHHRPVPPSVWLWDMRILLLFLLASQQLRWELLLCAAAGGHYLLSHGSSMHLSMQDVKNINLLMKPSYTAMQSSAINGLNQICWQRIFGSVQDTIAHLWSFETPHHKLNCFPLWLEGWRWMRLQCLWITQWYIKVHHISNDESNTANVLTDIMRHQI